MVVGLLRAQLIAAVAQGNVEKAAAIEDESRPEVTPAAAFRKLAEYYLHIVEAAAGEPAARDLGAYPAISVRRIGEVDKVIFGVTGMQGDVEEAALSGGSDRWQPRDRLAVEPAILADQAQAAGA